MATQQEKADIAVLKSQMDEVKKKLDVIDQKLDNNFVTRREMTTVKWALGVLFAIAGFFGISGGR